MTTSPKVSVVIPVHNGQDYVGQTIESILSQTFRDFELLLLDDASSDGSPSIMKGYTDPRIRLVRNEVNIGIARMHNKGIDLARGEYIAMLDHDDVSYPERLARQVAFLEAHPDYALIGTWGELLDERGRRYGKAKKYPVSAEDVRSSLLFWNCVLHPSIMARRAIMEAYRYSERFSICDDFDLFVRMGAARRLGNLPQVLVAHRRHAARTSNTKAHLKRGENLDIFRWQLAELGVTFDERDVERHYTLARIKTLAFRPDQEYVEWAEGWFRKLEEANSRSSRYSTRSLARVLGTMWFKVCWHASATAGWSVWGRFFRSPMCKGAWASLGEQLMWACGANRRAA